MTTLDSSDGFMGTRTYIVSVPAGSVGQASAQKVPSHLKSHATPQRSMFAMRERWPKFSAFAIGIAIHTSRLERRPFVV
jgi:hypothetical protein